MNRGNGHHASCLPKNGGWYVHCSTCLWNGPIRPAFMPAMYDREEHERRYR